MPLQSISRGNTSLLAFLLLACACAHAAVISAPSQIVPPGQTVVASILFLSEGQRISGIQFDLEWDGPIDVKVAMGDPLRASTKLMYAATPAPRVLRCLLIAMNRDPLPDGQLVRLFLVANADAPVGAAGIRFSHAVATDPDGNAVPLGVQPVSVQIRGSGGFSMPAEAVLNGASFSPGPVAPGEIITMFGFVPPASDLLFNGIPAPVLYAGANQLNAIVPFGLDVSAPASVVLRTRNAQPEARTTLPVALVAPAIFTQFGSGSGPGAILNEDFSINSFANPAAPGSTVMAFGTGFGALDPPAVDGQVATGIAVTRLPVTASVAGISADVLYAGAAPGLVAGVVQINVRVPNGVRTDPAAPILFTIGSVRSSAGVTLSIR